MRCVCPKTTALVPIPAFTCPTRIDQIVRLVFQRIQVGGASTFPTAGATPNPIEDIASWDVLKAANDDKKIILAPYNDSLVIPPSEGQEEAGGDNTTLFGIAIDLGEAPVRVSLQYRDLPAEVANALDALRCESQVTLGRSNLGVYGINQFGQIIANTGTDGPVPIPVYNFRKASRGTEGLNQSDKIPASFYLPPNWDKDLTIITPEFNPLFQL